MTTDQEKIKDLERKLLLEKEARKIAEEVYAESSIQFAAEKENLTDQLEVGSDMLSKLQNLFNVLKAANDVLKEQYNSLQKSFDEINLTKEKIEFNDALNSSAAKIEDLKRENKRYQTEVVPGLVIEKAKEIIAESLTELPAEFDNVKKILNSKLEEYI